MFLRACAQYLCLYVCTPAVRLQSYRTTYLHVCTPAAHLQSSRALYLSTSTSTYLHRASRAPYLHVCAPAARLQSSRASIPPHLHARSASPELPSSIPPCLYVCRLPELPSSISPRPHACSTTPELPSSIPLAYRLAGHLQSSILLYLHLRYTYIAPLRASDLHASIPPHRYAYVRPPVLYTSLPPRRYTCSATRSFRALCLHVATPALSQQTSLPPYLPPPPPPPPPCAPHPQAQSSGKRRRSPGHSDSGQALVSRQELDGGSWVAHSVVTSDDPILHEAFALGSSPSVHLKSLNPVLAVTPGRA